jgi:hypothetical protein
MVLELAWLAHCQAILVHYCCPDIGSMMAYSPQAISVVGLLEGYREELAYS